MKYLIRRLIASVIVMPLIGGAYLFAIFTLVLMGFDSLSLTDAYSNAILIGIVSGLAFVFAPQISKTLDKVVG